ncbi:hypothetical protein GGI43DRAFT_385298 [Trichoderma evansii]
MSNPENFISGLWKEGIFSNRVVFCTGESSDICSSQVRALVYLGANACIIGRNKEKAERVAADIATSRRGAKVLGYGNVDVRDLSNLEAAVKKCVAELGGIDFVIAGAAGIFLAPFLKLSANAFKTVIDIDLMGSWNTIKATVPYLLEYARKHPGSGGRIIFLSATLHYTSAPLNTNGTVAKAGVDILSAQVAVELGPYGITSNVISPGIIEGTEGQKRLFAKGSQRTIEQIPLGRFGTVFIFSEAGCYMNGTVQAVDGGAWRIGGNNLSPGWNILPVCFWRISQRGRQNRKT